MKLISWIGILLCLTQSASLSGLNLAFFNISKLKLELEVQKENKDALKVLQMRKDTNFLLVSILWANVAVNVILSLLSGSVLGGLAAFFFSTVVITIIGEIIPQAYFSRNAIKMAAKLAPLLKFYQLILFPVAKPTALLLDHWLGKEAIKYYPEKDFRELVKIHMQSSETEIEKMEGIGVLNFLHLDDLPISKEGEIIDPDSIIEIEFNADLPVFPEIKPDIDDLFLKKVQLSEKKWVILKAKKETKIMAINADKFIRGALFDFSNFKPLSYCHRPIIVTNDKTSLKEVIPRLKVNPEHAEDDVIDQDIILLWSKNKKIITGSDILGRLLRGIVRNP